MGKGWLRLEGRWGVFIVSVGLITGVGTAALCSAEEETPPSPVAQQASEKSEEAVNQAELAKLEKRLDEVLASQEQVLQKFDAAMEELRIIKIRATTSSRSSACP